MKPEILDPRRFEKKWDSFSDISGDTYEEKLQVLVSCNCCDRHQINKPSQYCKYIETKYPTMFDIPLCRCNCRHLARFICRQYPDKF